MIPDRLRSSRAQTQAEYAVVIASIAIACIVAVVYFGGTATGLWDRNTDQASVFSPPDSGDPTSTTTFAAPTTDADCKNDGYKNYPDLYPSVFDDEPGCITYVNKNAGP